MMYDVEARTVCELVDVDVEVLHAGLSSQECVDLIKRLDGPNDLFLNLLLCINHPYKEQTWILAAAVCW